MTLQTWQLLHHEKLPSCVFHQLWQQPRTRASMASLPDDEPYHRTSVVVEGIALFASCEQATAANVYGRKQKDCLSSACSGYVRSRRAEQP